MMTTLVLMIFDPTPEYLYDDIQEENLLSLQKNVDRMAFESKRESHGHDTT